ncbi:MAG TPA: trypsin-like peptidase domain-containing protein [Streptosporangiaceae bacterium]|nr:trypsin-like peptidase domain-containing protein [Streptosporangiaceae bacterium]
MALVALIAGAALTACDSAGVGQIVPVQSAYKRIIARNLHSVVQIDSERSTGSGVVFDAKGDIVTNAHVVDGAKSYQIRTSAAARPLAAHMVGSFAPDDLAVIRVTGRRADLAPVHWANSDRAQVGQIVLAMGSPYGLIDSVTQGIISATGRTVIGPTIAGRSPSVIADALQTSAAINPGNSGGALVELSGGVLGIPTLEARDPDLGGPAEGIGFAIPSNTVRDIASQLISKGRVTKSDRASLQVTGTTHTPPQGSSDGVTIDATKPGGAAAVAGIKAGDIITGLGGAKTPTLADLDELLIGYKPGDRVKVDVLRDGAREQFVVKLGSLSSGGP